MSAVTQLEKQPSTETHSGDPGKQVQLLVDKKIRNLEKRKARLEQLQEELAGGKGLNDDQKKAVKKYDDVLEILEFLRDFGKNVSQIFQESSKVAKKAARKEQLEHQQQEMERLKTILLYQDLLIGLGDTKSKKDFLNGANGAVKLDQQQLDNMDELYKVVSPNRDDMSIPFPQQVDQAAVRLVSLADGKQKDAWTGVTYTQLKETLTMVDNSGYFNRNVPEPVPEQIAIEPELTNAQPSAPPISVQPMMPLVAAPTAVNFLQDSTLPQDPAIVSMMPQGMPYPPQFIENGNLSQIAGPKFENGSMIPTQTFTNAHYASYGQYVAAPVTVAQAGMQIPAHLQQLPLSGDMAINSQQAYDQPEYVANMEHLRISSSQEKPRGEGNNGNFRRDARGRGGGGRGNYRGGNRDGNRDRYDNRNQNGGQNGGQYQSNGFGRGGGGQPRGGPRYENKRGQQQHRGYGYNNNSANKEQQEA
ncbi:Caprin-1 [Halotydeus destructor]|nr:Caprin-1 [Halotydeus destructor]